VLGRRVLGCKDREHRKEGVRMGNKWLEGCRLWRKIGMRWGEELYDCTNKLNTGE
jgi:hypothetical protein